MVLLKRLDYGFNGYQEPPIPRAPRSIRRRGSKVVKRTEDSKMCAFDLLATVAGSLLLEKAPTPSNDKNSENQEPKVEPSDMGLSGCGQVYDSCPISGKESSFPREEDPSGASSVTTGLVAETSDDREKKNEVVGSFCSKIEETTDPPPAVYRESGGCKLDDDGDKLVKEDEPSAGAKAPFCGAHALQRDDVKIGSRDDDENSSGCTHPSPSWTRRKHFRQAPRIGDRRIRKILASKYWRAMAPKFKDDSLSSHGFSDRILKPYRSRKEYQKRQRSQMAIPFKKRKIFDHTSGWSTDGGINSNKGNMGEASYSCSKLQGGKGTPRSVAGQHTSFQRRDSHVKLRIKSFRVPELFIEIPETATVGSLKRTVMEAVTAILGGELRIGVLLQGQKVRDDNVTLLQSGISHDDQLDSLGFTLEPNLSESPKPCTGESHFLTDDEPLPLVRYPSPVRIDRGESDLSPEPDVPNLENPVESDHDSAPCPIDVSIEKKMGNSKALVTVPEVSVKALAVIPAIRKSKRPEMSQRRIRRPFSVTEVEALVHTVEKLGTGRWRDVKLRAFDDAKHRTYVDLKDKWKTLVHTARIAPQQRRGEPVPQELLDRVLKAHSYWSQQQAKQQLKIQSETCLLI